MRRKIRIRPTPLGEARASLCLKFLNINVYLNSQLMQTTLSNLGMFDTLFIIQGLPLCILDRDGMLWSWSFSFIALQLCYVDCFCNWIIDFLYSDLTKSSSGLGGGEGLRSVTRLCRYMVLKQYPEN